MFGSKTHIKEVSKKKTSRKKVHLAVHFHFSFLFSAFADYYYLFSFFFFGFSFYMQLLICPAITLYARHKTANKSLDCSFSIRSSWKKSYFHVIYRKENKKKNILQMLVILLSWNSRVSPPTDLRECA